MNKGVRGHLTERGETVGFEIPSLVAHDALVDWPAVHSVVAAIASVTDGTRSLQSAKALAAGLSSPLRLLEDVQILGRRALSRDRGAITELALRTDELAARLPGLVDAGRLMLNTQSKAIYKSDEIKATELINATLINFDSFAEALIAIYRTCDSEDRSVRDTRVCAVLGLYAQTLPLQSLHKAFHTRGISAVADELRWQVMTGLHRFLLPQFPQLPQLRTMSGGLPGAPPIGLPPGTMPVFPGIPPPEDVEDIPRFVVDWLKKQLAKQKPRFDPEIWDHKPIYLGPWFDPRETRCAVALGKLATANASEPVRPAKVVWSDNITSIQAPNPCAGNMLTIHGHGFGTTRPSNIGLTLPRDGECTPTPFVPGTWSDTTIEVLMPPDITSGPVGFVDMDYVATYNLWVDTINNALTNLVLEGCGSRARDMLDHFHECATPTPVNSLLAGSAYIHAFTANGDASLVVEPGEVVTFNWDVVNAASLRLVRVSASGPLLGGKTAANNLPAVGSLTITAAHTGPEDWEYKLMAVGICADAQAAVKITATKRPALRIADVEVTQGIQTVPASVRLVAGKPTVVRVRVQHGLNGWGSNAVSSVTGRIELRYGSSSSGWIDAANGSSPRMMATPGATITVPASPLRTNTDDQLNFLVPGSLCIGSPTIYVEVRVQTFDARPSFSGWSDRVTSTSLVKFEVRKALELRYVQIRTSNGTVSTPAQCIDAIQSALPMLPTPTANIAAAPVGVVFSFVSLPQESSIIDGLDDAHNCSTWEALTEWLGSDCPDDDSAIWVGIGVGTSGGLARDSADVCIAGDDWAVDVAHEISHCLGQQHLTSACSSLIAPPDGAENANGFPANGSVADTPFNLWTNQAVSSTNGLWDLMTYCGKADCWTSPERWRRLWDAIG